MTHIRHFSCNPFQERSYAVWNDEGEAFLVDPGFLGETETAALDAFLAEQGIRPMAVLLTHAHFDHIYAVAHCVKAYGVPVYLHPDERVVLEGVARFASDSYMPVPDTDWIPLPIPDNGQIRLGAFTIRCIPTPGHSPGSVCYFLEADGLLFSGDTLFAGSIGNTQLPWGDYDKEIVSVMDSLMGLEPDVQVFPGHGGPTTIGWERTHNPFLQPFNWKDPETGWVDGIEFR